MAKDTNETEKNFSVEQLSNNIGKWSILHNKTYDKNRLIKAYSDNLQWKSWSLTLLTVPLPKDSSFTKQPLTSPATSL